MIKYDIRNYENRDLVEENITEIAVIDFLLRAGEMDYNYQVTVWDYGELEADDTPLLLEQMSGDEWLAENL